MYLAATFLNSKKLRIVFHRKGSWPHFGLLFHKLVCTLCPEPPWEILIFLGNLFSSNSSGYFRTREKPLAWDNRTKNASHPFSIPLCDMKKDSM
jgi:hypothetical protein